MEQKAAHTPAPWIADLGEAHRVRAQQDGGQVAIMMNLKGQHGLAGRRSGDEVAANAHLIAAAPQLLEALQTTAANLRSWKAANGGGIKTFDSWLEVVEEAIAKAEGGAA